MSTDHRPKTRRRKSGKDDGKGERRMIAGERFRTPGISGSEANQRFDRIEDVWRDNKIFCQRQLVAEPNWNYIARWAAESIRKGDLRIQIPPIDDIVGTYWEADQSLPPKLSEIVWSYVDDDCSTAYPDKVAEMQSAAAIEVYEILSEAFPSVSWVLPKHHYDVQLKRHEQIARLSLEKLAKIKNETPPDPATPLIAGTYHEALIAYEEKRRQDFTEPDGTFDGSGHHFLGIIKAIRERRPDFKLAELDFRKCWEEYDYWRNRPENLRKEKKGQRLSAKTCGNYVGELTRFFNWLHVERDFGWKRPEDHDLLKKDIRDLKGDRRSVTEMVVKVFSLEELMLLYRNAVPFERFLMTWCLNCAHGDAEIGRFEWGDLFLSKEHPWQSKGLRIESTADDNWCGLTRPKSDVIG